MKLIALLTLFVLIESSVSIRICDVLLSVNYWEAELQPGTDFKPNLSEHMKFEIEKLEVFSISHSDTSGTLFINWSALLRQLNREQKQKEIEIRVADVQIREEVDANNVVQKTHRPKTAVVRTVSQKELRTVMFKIDESMYKSIQGNDECPNPFYQIQNPAEEDRWLMIDYKGLKLI